MYYKMLNNKLKWARQRSPSASGKNVDLLYIYSHTIQMYSYIVHIWYTARAQDRKHSNG
jgi:hypothetical protein